MREKNIHVYVNLSVVVTVADRAFTDVHILFSLAF